MKLGDELNIPKVVLGQYVGCHGAKSESYFHLYLTALTELRKALQPKTGWQHLLAVASLLLSCLDIFFIF